MKSITIITGIFLIMSISAFAGVETYRRHPPTGDCEPKSYEGEHKIYTPRMWPFSDKIHDRDTWSGSVGEGGSTSWDLAEMSYSNHSISYAEGTMHGVRTPWDFTKLIMDYTIKLIKTVPWIPSTQ